MAFSSGAGMLCHFAGRTAENYRADNSKKQGLNDNAVKESGRIL